MHYKLCQNGLYVSSDPTKDYKSYLRFYFNGTVLDVSSPDEVNKVGEWLSMERAEKPFSIGFYKTTNDKIEFNSTGKYGTVEYVGQVQTEALELFFYSHINGNCGIRKYQFVECNLEEPYNFY